MESILTASSVCPGLAIPAFANASARITASASAGCCAPPGGSAEPVPPAAAAAAIAGCFGFPQAAISRTILISS